MEVDMPPSIWPNILGKIFLFQQVKAMSTTPTPPIIWGQIRESAPLTCRNVRGLTAYITLKSLGRPGTGSIFQAATKKGITISILRPTNINWYYQNVCVEILIKTQNSFR